MHPLLKLPKKKLVIEYSQLRRKLSSFQDLDPPAHSADKETPAVTSTPAVREPTAGNLDSNRVLPVSPLRADGDVSVDIQALSKANSFEQFSSEDETNQPTSRSRGLASTPPSIPAPPHDLTSVRVGPVVPEFIHGSGNHTDEPDLASTRPESAQRGGLLSAQPSFKGFSSEEEEGPQEVDTERDSAGPGSPSPRTNEIPAPSHTIKSGDVAPLRLLRDGTHDDPHCKITPSTPRRISSFGSFQDFSDEEAEDIQPTPGSRSQNANQLLYNNTDDLSTGGSILPLENSIGWTSSRPSAHWPDVPFSPSGAGSGPSARGLRDKVTSTRLKHDAYVERARRVKFDAERPFAPRHRPFAPRTSTAGGSIPLPLTGWSSATAPKPIRFTSATQAPCPGPSRHTASNPNDDLDCDEEMIDVESPEGFLSPPTVPNQRVGATGPSTGTHHEDLSRTSRPSLVSYLPITVDSLSDVVYILDQPHSACNRTEYGLRG